MTICKSEDCEILRVIFNFSSYELTDDEKDVLCKRLNFSVKPELIEYSGLIEYSF